MRLQRVLITTFAALLLIGTAVSAHHSFAAEFDSNKPIQLKGTVVRVEWINPHTWIHMAVKDADGKTEEWMIEGGTPNTLLRRGLTKDVLARGHRDRRRRLPREERLEQSERPRRDVPRRPQALYGIVGHRRAKRRERFVRALIRVRPFTNSRADHTVFA